MSHVWPLIELDDREYERSSFPLRSDSGDRETLAQKHTMESAKIVQYNASQVLQWPCLTLSRYTDKAIFLAHHLLRTGYYERSAGQCDRRRLKSSEK